MGRTLGSTNIRIGADLSQFQAAMKTASVKLKRFGRQAKQVGTTLSTGLSAPIAAIGATSVMAFKDFEAEMAKVQAVSGATAAEFKRLEKNAKDLGSSTVFSASQVAGLQVEFAKLGFTASEIEKVTEATLNLAQASDSELPRAAEVAGSTLRAFGLEASETGRVTDVMASSFSTSALDMESFAESMKYVAPVAKAAGISLEETTAMLGALANSGIKGSMAGTALKKILGEMTATGKPLSNQLADLAAKGLDLAGAKDEVGERAQTALLVLKDSVGVVGDLKEQYDNAEGSAKAMADTMNDTTQGAFKALQSAAEGAQIAIGESIAQNEIFQEILTKLTAKLQGITKYIGGLSDAQLYNKTVMIGLTAAVPLLVAAIGSLTLAFGSLTAAMGPVAIVIGGIVLAYQALKKEVTESDAVIQEALKMEGTMEAQKKLKERLDEVNEKLAMYRDWESKDALSNYTEQINGLLEEQAALTKALGDVESKRQAQLEEYRAAEKSYAQEQKAAQEAVALQAQQSFVALENASKKYQEVSVLASDALHRLGQKFAEIEQQALAFGATTRAQLNQAIDLTGGLAYEFSQNLGDAIQQAMMNGEGFFKSFINGLKAMAARLVATIALAATLAAILTLATGGLAGFSAQSFGTAFKAVNATAGLGIPFLAEGGIVTSPTLAMIGEGRESEAVIPLSKLAGMVGGTSGGSVQVYGRISGSDILLSSERASNNRNRSRGY